MSPAKHDEQMGRETVAPSAASKAPIPGTKRLFLLILNCLPLLHLILVAAVVWAGPWGLAGRFCAAALVLYLLPPLAARMLLAALPIRRKRILSSDREFYVWWALLNFQVLFSRFHILEEFLRCIPSLYSAWLRLWGARIGRLTYWAAGTVILDRPFLNIGDDVIFGAGVRLNPHVMVRDEDGIPELLLDTVVIGDRALVGGYSLLTTGTVLAADECTRAFLVSPPFSKWQGGRRIKPQEDERD